MTLVPATAEAGAEPNQRHALDLIPFTRADCARLAAWIETPETLFDWAGAFFTFPLDRKQLWRHLVVARLRHRLVFKAVDPRTGTAVGHIEIVALRRGGHGASLNHVLVDPRLRRTGIGMAMVEAALKKAFDDLGLHRVSLHVFEGNVSARALYERTGFVTEGILRDSARLNGVYRSIVLMSILEHEWRARRGGDERTALEGARTGDSVARAAE